LPGALSIRDAQTLSGVLSVRDPRDAAGQHLLRRQIPQLLQDDGKLLDAARAVSGRQMPRLGQNLGDVSGRRRSSGAALPAATQAGSGLWVDPGPKLIQRIRAQRQLGELSLGLGGVPLVHVGR